MATLKVDRERLARFQAETEARIARGELASSPDSIRTPRGKSSSISTISPGILGRLREIADDAPSPDWELVSEELDRQVEAETRARRERFEEALDVELGIPARFSEMRLPTYPDKRAAIYRSVRAWILSGDDLKPGLFLAGSAGVGKTALAISALRARVGELGYRGDYRRSPRSLGWFVHEIDLLEELRSESTGDANGTPVRDRARSVPVLLIDDLGSMSLSEWRYAQLFRLIDARHSARLATIITSNDPPESFDDRISGRINELCEIVEAGDRAKDWRAN